MTTLNVKTDFGAVGDGSTDDTQAFNEAWRAAENGDTILIPATNEHYLVTSSARGAINIDGSIADNVTIEGEGYDSFIRMGDVNNDINVWTLGVECDGASINGLEIRDLRISGNRFDNPQARGSGFSSGINFYPTGGGHDITFEHVMAENSGGDGFALGANNAVMRWCTAKKNDGHGIKLKEQNQPNGDWGILVENCKSVNNGQNYPGGGGNGYNMNGNVKLDTCYGSGNPAGNKISDIGKDQEQWWLNCNFENDKNSSLRETVQNGTFIAHVDNVRIADNASNGCYLGGPDGSNWDINDLLIENCNTTGDFDGGVKAANKADLNAARVHAYDNTGVGIRWESTGTGLITEYCYSSNSDGNVSDANGNLTINSQTNQDPVSLNVPGKDDVGAWNEPEDDTDGVFQSTDAVISTM